MQNRCLNLFRMPHAAPHRCCFCLKPCRKTLSSKDSGPASLPFCPLLLAWIWTSIFRWLRFGTAWLKVLELTRLDVLKTAKSSFDGECSLDIWERTYAISNWKSSWHEGCNPGQLFPWVRIATSCKQKPSELFCVESTPSQCKIIAWISSECPMLHPIDVASASSPAKRLWVQKIPAQHHCHLVLCCLHGSGHQSSIGYVLAQLGWKS